MADLLMDRLPGIPVADDGEAAQLSFRVRDLEWFRSGFAVAAGNAENVQSWLLKIGIWLFTLQ